MLQAPMFMKVDGGKLNGQITVKALLQWCREILFQLSVSSSVPSIVLDLWLSIAIFQCRSVGVSECSSCISFRMRRIAIESASSAATKKRLRQPGQLAPTMQDYTLDKWMLEKWWLLFDCCYEQRPFLSSFIVHIYFAVILGNKSITAL